jgi:hypothetical protein
MDLNLDNVNFLKELSTRRILLREWVMAYYGCNILKYDTSYDELISKVIDKTVELNNIAQSDVYHPLHYRGSRINEYGNHLENVLCEAITELTGEESENLGVGYPDCRTSLNGIMLYPEVKIGPNLESEGTMRSFYTSVPSKRTAIRKNLKDGMHLLFKFEHAGIGVLTGRCKVVDLYNMEYNAVTKQEGNDLDIFACESIYDNTFSNKLFS